MLLNNGGVKRWTRETNMSTMRGKRNSHGDQQRGESKRGTLVSGGWLQSWLEVPCVPLCLYDQFPLLFNYLQESVFVTPTKETPIDPTIQLKISNSFTYKDKWCYYYKYYSLPNELFWHLSSSVFESIEAILLYIYRCWVIRIEYYNYIQKSQYSRNLWLMIFVCVCD